MPSRRKVLKSAQQADVLADRTAQEPLRESVEHDRVLVGSQGHRSQQRRTSAKEFRRHIRGVVSRDGEQIRRDRGDEHL